MGKANNEDEEGGKIGTTLHSRNPGNSATWDIVTEKNSNTTYGDGWNYVEEGTNIEGYGSARHKWVVNYETGDVIELDSSSVHSSAENSIVSPENLIFSLNSADFDLGAVSFGPNTKLYKCEEGLEDDSEETKSRWENGIADKDWANDENCYDREPANPEEFFDETNHAFKFEGHNYFEITKNTLFDITKRNDGRILWTTRKWKLGPRVCSSRTWYFFDLEWNKHVPLYDRSTETPLLQAFWWDLVAPYLRLLHTLNQVFGSSICIPQTPNSNTDTFVALSLHPPVNEGAETCKAEILYTPQSSPDKLVAEVINIDRGHYDQGKNMMTSATAINVGRVKFTDSASRKTQMNYMTGLCYSIRIYNRALTSEELQKDYTNSVTLHQLSLNS